MKLKFLVKSGISVGFVLAMGTIFMPHSVGNTAALYGGAEPCGCDDTFPECSGGDACGWYYACDSAAIPGGTKECEGDGGPAAAYCQDDGCTPAGTNMDCV